ncbi:MAG: zf-HC2 domain-containing protein [Candidatus Eisenbacteria sp.]|nr:zf-HC2 domain-containing protein [Candidatus Eisenbacteria bacterium]
MKHEEARELLGGYVDGLLPSEQAEDLQAHLEECRTCRNEVEQLRAIIEEAGSLPRSIEPEHDLWAAVAERTSEVEPFARAGGFRRFLGLLTAWRGFWPVAVPATTVAVLALFIALGTQGPARMPSEPGPAEWPGPDPMAGALIESLEAECEQGYLELAAYTAERDIKRELPVVGLIMENVRIVNRSIAELREAWSANSDSPRIARMLAAAYRTKIALQGRASRLAADT